MIPKDSDSITYTVRLVLLWPESLLGVLDTIDKTEGRNA